MLRGGAGVLVLQLVPTTLVLLTTLLPRTTLLLYDTPVLPASTLLLLLPSTTLTLVQLHITTCYTTVLLDHSVTPYKKEEDEQEWFSLLETLIVRGAVIISGLDVEPDMIERLPYWFAGRTIEL